jgi:alpha-tubulin suppressor-like RCC1 family protein
LAFVLFQILISQKTWVMKKIFCLLLISFVIAVQVTAQCWSKVSAGGMHTLALKNDGSLWAWGNNFYGQLGDGTNSNKTYPVQVGNSTDWTFVYASTGFLSLALKSNGTLWAWGQNFYGQLGNGTNTHSNIPVQVGSDNDWLMISPGNDYVLAIKTNLTLWAWGLNSVRQLGDGSTTNRNVPIQIGTDNDWTWVDGGFQTSLAIKNNGSLWAWGVNDAGLFGNGTTGTFSDVPLQVSTTNDWATLSASGHVMAQKTDGTLWAWGYNDAGQIGNGSTTNQLNPVQIGTDTDWDEVIAGGSFTLALKNDGSRWHWGSNVFGQYGNGAFFPASLVPAQLPFPTDWQSISVADATAFGIRTGFNLWGWGAGVFGNIGNGSTSNTAAPVQIDCGSTLPVTWLSVTGSIKNNNAEIKWATASETNTSHFEIQHSTDGIHYTKAGTVTAAGNSSITSNYNFTHTSVIKGRNFYHIKQVDMDGRFSHSSVIVINADREQQSISIAPNPAGSFIHVISNSSKPALARIYNMQGKIVLQQQLSAAQQQISIAALPAGVYQLQLQTNEGITTASFIKQ